MCGSICVVKTDAEREAVAGYELSWCGQNNSEQNEVTSYVSREWLAEMVQAGKEILCSIWVREGVTYADFYFMSGESA